MSSSTAAATAPLATPSRRKAPRPNPGRTRSTLWASLLSGAVVATRDLADHGRHHGLFAVVASNSKLTPGREWIRR
jgi:hypothetical protein